MIHTVPANQKRDLAASPTESQMGLEKRIWLYCERFVAKRFYSATKPYKKGNHRKDQHSAQDESSHI
jgi:hypothetical protein